jgi:hypothetical protein
MRCVCEMPFELCREISCERLSSPQALVVVCRRVVEWA